MVTLLPKGGQTKLLNFFCLNIFSISHRCRWHRWCTLSREYLREFSKKFEKAVLVYSDAWGKLIHEKTRSRKSRDTVPLMQYFYTRTYYICKNNASCTLLFKLSKIDKRKRGARYFALVFVAFQLPWNLLLIFADFLIFLLLFCLHCK